MFAEIPPRGIILLQRCGIIQRNAALGLFASGEGYMSTMIDEIEINYDELKSLVFETFRRRPDTQLASVLSDVRSGL